MKIAIVDTGIDPTHRKLKNAKITGISIKKQNREWIFTEQYIDTTGHGTACASIIHKHTPDSELIAVKIFHQDTLTREDSLIEALKWIKKDKNINLINISLSSIGAPNEQLYQICNELYHDGRFIIASCDNNMSLEAYPASFPCVFGVLAGQIKKSTDIGIYEKGQYFIAKGSVQRVAWAEKKDLIVTGTSYATPHLCGIIANILKDEPKLSFLEIKKKLLSLSNPAIKPMQFLNKTSYHARQIILSQNNEKDALKILDPKHKFKWIHNIGIFPISEKEMRQFLDFQEMCVFNINNLFDYPRTFTSFHPDDNTKYIRELPSEEEIKKIDTLVLGYYYDNLWEGNLSFGNALVEYALTKGINFFVYDNRIYDYISNKIKTEKLKNHIYLPHVDTETYNKISAFQFLPNIKCPVLSVIGTGSKQGKFTTQLRIKQILENENYTTGFISTEPQGELFGANFSFPYGYMPTISLSPSERLLFLRYLFKGVSYFIKPHIIITGTQCAVIPQNPLTSIPYLRSIDALTCIYAALPDIVVCTINPNDSIEYIKNTIATASIYSKCETAFYVITPWVQYENEKFKRKLTEEQLNKRIDHYVHHLKKPVLNIMDTKNNSFIVKCIERLCN